MIRLQDDYQNRNRKTKEDMEIDKLKELLKEKDAIIAEKEDNIQRLKTYEDAYEELVEMNKELLVEKRDMAETIESLQAKKPACTNLT